MGTHARPRHDASAWTAHAAPPVVSSTDSSTDKPKKKRRIFLWFFLAVQAIFILWLVVGLSTANTGGDAAKEVGTTIGAALVFGLWVGVDFILGLTYGVYRLATRK